MMLSLNYLVSNNSGTFLRPGQFKRLASKSLLGSSRVSRLPSRNELRGPPSDSAWWGSSTWGGGQQKNMLWRIRFDVHKQMIIIHDMLNLVTGFLCWHPTPLPLAPHFSLLNSQQVAGTMAGRGEHVRRGPLRSLAPRLVVLAPAGGGRLAMNKTS